MSSTSDQTNALDTEAINNFREYLRIPSVHPNVNYDACVKFLKKQASSLGLPINVHIVAPGKPVAVITWAGREPSLPSILFNSHMDVVPVFENKWTHIPFAAEIADGIIYARGSQDTKGTGIIYLEAVRRLKLNGVSLKRTIHISFVPDEEIGGNTGMKLFVETKGFRDLNLGAAFDEGRQSPDNNYLVSNGERTRCQFRIHCPGNTGHGSLLLDNTPGEKVRYLLNKFFTFRDQEKAKLKDNPNLTIGDVTTVNLTQISGGVQVNVIPAEFIITIDCRLALTVDHEKWEQTIKQWCKEAGPDVWIEYISKDQKVPPTALDSSNLYWIAFKQTFDHMNETVVPSILSGATDGRYLRQIGIPTLGFGPMKNTPKLAHGNDEHVSMSAFLRGIDLYYNIFRSVANVD